jgi:hypothetical protein
VGRIMITKDQLFIGRNHTSEQDISAQNLLSKVNALLYEYQADTGHELPINPHTGTLISGVTEGGFRLPECPQGAPNSSHKEAKAVDIFDPNDDLDTWVTDEILTRYDLYREAPSETLSWCHLSTRSPKSGHRTFFP